MGSVEVRWKSQSWHALVDGVTARHSTMRHVVIETAVRRARELGVDVVIYRKDGTVDPYATT